MGGGNVRLPDFSGEYVLNREVSALSAAVAEGMRSATLLIKHDEPSFSCQGTFFFVGDRKVEWAFELATDGPEAAEMESEHPGASMHWDGGALVFTSRSEGMTITFRYEFDAEGRLRLAEQLRGTDHDQDNLWIFDRR